MNDTEVIGVRRQEWVRAVNSRDRAAYAELFTPNAVWLPPGLPAVCNREAIREWLEPFFDRYLYEFSITSPRLRIGGDWAVERGAFTSTLTPVSGGSSGSHSGVYIVIWRKESDGLWYIDRYVDVTDISEDSHS